MDNAFSSKYNSEAKNYYGDKDDFVSKMNIARDNAVRNAYARIPNEPKEYRDFNYEYQAGKFIMDNHAQIYRGEDDPREAANAHNLAKIINKMYPTIPVEVAEKSYRPIIKSITGDDMSATNLMQVFGKTFANNFNSLLLGGRVYMHAMLSQPFQEGLPEEIQKKREEEYKQKIDEIKAAKGLNQRTDYYNKDFDSFIEQAVLSSATIIPSMIFSVGPEILGATLSAFTKMPIFYSIGHGVSAASAAFMEAGGSALEMYDAGADWDTIRGFSTIVGLANGVLEIVGNIPEYKINKALFGMQKLRKAVGATAGTELTRGLASTVFKKMAVNYGLGLVLEPGTEALQEMVSMYGMNLASKWEETHKGKSFSDEFTYTPQEMIDAMKEVAVSTFKGQLLVGLVGEGVDLYTNLRKSGQFLYNENTKTGFKWDAGDLRKIYDARKYSTFDSKSTFTNSDTIVTDNKTKAYSPAETDKKGRPTEKVTPVKVRSIGGEFVPINSEEMAKAKYIKENSEGMYINIVNDEAVTNEAMNSEGLKKIINSLPDEVDKHSVDYSFTEQGDIVISSKSDLNQIVKEFVNENIDRVSNVHENENGYTVTVDGQNVNFTTDAENATSFSQTDYVRSARETAETKKDEMTPEWESRIKDIQDRAREVQKLDSRKKASAFRSEINKVINSKIKDNEQRKAERAKIMSQTDKIAKETEKAYNAAIANNPNSDFAKAFKDRNVSEASKSFARGTVMAVSKLAQSMGMNTSEFLDKINFKYSVESMKGGKERAGWTEVHSDGTFDINVTSFLDQSTGIHEMGHAYLSMLGDNYKAIEGFEDVFKKELEQDNGKVGRNTQEAFAEALEAYVNEGLAKSEGLRKVFDLILDALRNFVNAVKELLSPEKVAMFDNLFEKGLKDFNAEDTTYNEDTFFAKDADDYVNDYNYNSERAYEALKNNDSELTERLKGITDVFSNGVLDYIKDEYGDGVDIVKIDENNAEADFLDGSDAADLVYKFLNDPMAMTYNDTFETDVTILLPSGDGLTVAIMARTDTQDFRIWRENYIREQLLHKSETEEEKVKTRRTFLSNMFEEIERDNYGKVERISYAGGASRYKGPEHNQSTKYINTGEEAQVFGWGLYESAVRAIAKHYADHVSASKGFGINEVKFAVSQFFRDYFSAFATKGPAALRKTNFKTEVPAININNDTVDLYNLGDVYKQIIEKNYEEIMKNGMNITKDDVLSEMDSIIANLESDAFRTEEDTALNLETGEKSGTGVYTWYYGDKDIGSSENSKDKVLAEIKGIRDDIASDKINLTTKPVSISKKPDTVAKTIHTNIISGDDSKFIPWEGEIPHMVIEDVIEHVAAEMDRTGKGYYLDALYDYISSFDEKTGEDLYHALSAVMWNADKEASRILKEMGYEGIKYMADSRGSHYNEGYNYVIFDDAFVKTIREEEMDEQGNIVADRKWNKDVSPIYFKDADLDMSEDEVADRLGKGMFVPNEVLDKYPDHPFVKLERLVQNIVGTKPEWFKLYKRSVDEYIKENGLTLEDFGKWNYRQILNDWNKRLKGANEYMEIPVDTNGDYIYFLRRLNAYANMESPERAETAWMDKLNHTRNGRDNIRNLALEMDKLGLFDDKLEGYDLSARFPALNMIAKKAKSSDERGTRVRIDVSVYDQAKDEAFRNRQFIREKMNDDNTNIYEANMEESDTNVNYMESADIQEILKEKNVSREIKNLVKNGMWDGTVVRDLMKKSTETLMKLNKTNSTLDLTERELAVEKEKVKIYQSEIDKLEQGVSEKNNAEMQRYKDKLHEAKVRIYDLELTKSALSDLLAAEKLSAALYKTQRQILDIVKAKNGEADADRALRETVKRIVNFTEKNRTKNPKLAVKVDLEEMKYQHDGEGNRVKDEEGNYVIGKAPNLAKFLEDNKLVDKEGNLLRGIDKMDVNELKAFKKAVQTDKDNSKSRHKQDQRQFEAKTQSLASKILTSMKPKQVEKKLTDEDRNAIKNEVEKRTEGKDLTRAEREQIEGEVLGEVLAQKIQDIADGARYGIESHTEETNKRHIMKDFLTLSRLLREISPELEKFVMDGLNKMTDGKYRMVDSRMKTFFDNIKSEYKFKTDKELKTFLNSLVTDRREIGRVDRENIPQRLKNNKLFMEMWDKDEKNPKRQAPSMFKYSIQDLMAIEEQSLEWDGLRHLNGGCEIPAAEIAWVVREFESKDGSLAYYKPAADEIRRVYGERFNQLYDTVLSVENREMTKVSFYSPMFGVGLDKDLMMKFSDLFGDDRKAQANWFTKDREFGTNAIDLNYYSRLEKVVEMQEAYINGAEFYRQLDHLFSENGGNLRNIISEVYGAPQFKRIEGLLDLTKSDAVRNVISEADNMASKIRNHYVMARLAYNMSSVFQQVGSWFLGFSKYGPIQLWKSSLQFIMHPIEMSKRVYELSPQMKHAVNPMLRMAYETGKANPTTAFGKIDKFVASIGEKGLTLMEKQDHIIRNILWWTAYQDEIAKAQKNNNGVELTAEQKDECQRNATQWVLDIQSSSQVKDNSMMYSGGNLFWKQVLMFTNQLNKEWNMLYFDALKEGLFQKQYGKFFANFAALGLATMWVVACTGKIKNDEDDDETWAEDLIKDWGFEFASRIPIAGNLVKNVYEGFSYKQNDDIVSRLTQAILTLANEKAKKKSKITALKNVGWSGLDLFGAPTTAIKRFSQAFEDGEIMEADHFMRLFGGEWYKYFEE